MTNRQPVADIDWTETLNEAFSAPGFLGDTYTRFHNYSFLNQIRLMMQGVNEPCAPYKVWQSLGRQVRAGASAKYVRAPSTRRKTDTDELDDPVLDERGKPVKRDVHTGRFHWRKSAFGYSDTDGPELEFPELPEWNMDAALHALGIRRVPFDEINGNIQGYSREVDGQRAIAINPVAQYPGKTLMHELAHIVLGHCKDLAQGSPCGRELAEGEAESTAYILGKQTGMTQWDPAESRAYIQTWMAGRELEKSSVQRIFAAVDTILRAGRTDAAEAAA
jgi:hypothetical protein